jgi:ParB family transcriptional regulator, chromosome partitioning protein
MKTIEIDINIITPYSKNQKIHTEIQIQKVAKSIERFGFLQPLVLDKKNNIVIGHCRYEASKLLGLKTVPCVIVDKLTDNEIKALRIADNKLNESDWDMKLVIEELSGLELNNFDITLTGFSKIDLNDYEELDFDNIKDNSDRELNSKEMTVICPECNNTFKIKV